MDEYNYILTSDGELYHWKYIKREKVNGKWKYYYDAKSAKDGIKSSLSKIRSRFSSMVDKKTKSASLGKTVKTASKTAGKTVVARLKSAASKVENLVNRAKKTAHKYIAKVPTSGGTFRYFYSDEAYKSYLNGKKSADSALKKVNDKKLGTLIDDATKNAVDGFMSKVMNSGFGKAVYNVALPALTAVQVAIETPNSIKDMKKIDRKVSNDEHQKTVNPNYDPKTLDYSYNCSFCTATYDLRRRGYDVEAMPISSLEGPVIEDILSWYKGATAVSESRVQSELPDDKAYSNDTEPAKRNKRRAEALTNSLEQYGDGARGHLAMYWRAGSGHDIAWEVEKGEVVFRDCQTNQIVDIADTLRYVRDYNYVRVDNCEITEEVLRTVRNRK